VNDRRLRPLGFLLLMLGLGLRLDTPWQTLAALLIVGGTVTAGAGLWRLARRVGMRTAFVSNVAEE